MKPNWLIVWRTMFSVLVRYTFQSQSVWPDNTKKISPIYLNICPKSNCIIFYSKKVFKRSQKHPQIFGLLLQEDFYQGVEKVAQSGHTDHNQDWTKREAVVSPYQCRKPMFIIKNSLLNLLWQMMSSSSTKKQKLEIFSRLPHQKFFNQMKFWSQTKLLTFYILSVSAQLANLC